MAFQDELKPDAIACKAAGKAAYRAVLRLNGVAVWRGPYHLVSASHDAEAKQRALEDAGFALMCDDDSLMAEELAELVNQQ